MTIFLNVISLIIGFAGMEFVAWFSHKYIMHGFMWRWHKSHHEPREGRFEKNDLFGLFYAGISASLIIAGSMLLPFDWKFYLGVGIFLYGVAYFLIHDVFVHRRLPWFRNTNSVYFKALRYAHKIHHKTLKKEGAEAFGFLFVSAKYLSKFRKSISE